MAHIGVWGQWPFFFNVFHRACIIFKPVLDSSGGYAILYHDTIYSAGKEYLSLNTSKKAERTKEIIGACLDCFVEKGLMQLAKMKGRYGLQQLS